MRLAMMLNFRRRTETGVWSCAANGCWPESVSWRHSASRGRSRMYRLRWRIWYEPESAFSRFPHIRSCNRFDQTGWLEVGLLDISGIEKDVPQELPSALWRKSQFTGGCRCFKDASVRESDLQSTGRGFELVMSLPASNPQQVVYHMRLCDPAT